jgi:chemotaxis signal transduction protein
MPDNSLQILRCLVENGAYGFDTAQVRAIHRWESVQPPQAEGEIGRVGVAPVYPLARLLGLTTGPVSSQGPVLLLDGFGVQVDRVSRPAAVAWQDLRRLPRLVRQEGGCWQAVTRVDGELTLCLSPEAIDPGPKRRQPVALPAIGEDPAWPPATSGETNKLLCFLPPAEDRETFFAVSYRQAIEVTNASRFTRIRTVSPCIAGVMDWRDRAVPVIDHEAMLGLAGGRVTRVDRVLVVRTPRTRELLAFPAGTLAPIDLPLPEDATVTRTLDPPSAYVRAAYGLSDGFLFVPDLERLGMALTE